MGGMERFTPGLASMVHLTHLHSGHSPPRRNVWICACLPMQLSKPLVQWLTSNLLMMMDKIVSVSCFDLLKIGIRSSKYTR